MCPIIKKHELGQMNFVILEQITTIIKGMNNLVVVNWILSQKKLKVTPCRQGRTVLVWRKRPSSHCK